MFHLLKILSSSELFVTSELEVFNAADKWLNYNIEERIKFAEQLLSKIRLSLLPEVSLKDALNKWSSFSALEKNNESLNEVLKNKELLLRKSLSTSRSCSQEAFYVLVYGGHDRKLNKPNNIVTKINVHTFKTLKSISPIENEQGYRLVVRLKGEAYIFGYNRGTNLNFVGRYSPATDSYHEVVNGFERRTSFCACAFVDKIYIFGGYSGRLLDSCLQFDPKHAWWSEISKMREARKLAACAVFEERIVVSGGKDNRFADKNTVESLDVAAGKWSKMPNMVEGKFLHSLVVVKRKLFAIDCGSCEIFDSSCNKFVILKSFLRPNLNRALSVGSKIFILQFKLPFMIIYDVDEDKWSKELFEVTESLYNFCCVKLPVC